MKIWSFWWSSFWWSWLENKIYTDERPIAIDLETWIQLYLNVATQALKVSDTQTIKSPFWLQPTQIGLVILVTRSPD